MMTQAERDRIGEKLTEFAVIYDRTDIDKTKISMMISVIERTFPNQTAQKISKALQDYFADRKNKTFPSVIALRDYLDPVLSPEGRAQEIVSRIVQSISKFGYSNPEGAKQHIGEVGWMAVRRWGGWEQICTQHGHVLDANSFFAQTRQMVLSFLEQEKLGLLNDTAKLDFKKENAKLNAPLFTEAETEKLSQELKHLPKNQMTEILEKIAQAKFEHRKKEETEAELDGQLTRLR